AVYWGLCDLLSATRNRVNRKLSRELGFKWPPRAASQDGGGGGGLPGPWLLQSGGSSQWQDAVPGAHARSAPGASEPGPREVGRGGCRPCAGPGPLWAAWASSSGTREQASGTCSRWLGRWLRFSRLSLRVTPLDFDCRRRIRICCDELNLLVPFCNAETDKATTLQWTTAFLKYIQERHGDALKKEFESVFCGKTGRRLKLTRPDSLITCPAQGSLQGSPSMEIK
uniref:BHLH domain-containing protein n=1 Tax=Oryctolagus cuniculus TaxID=9986 RepID=G1TN85_RABIT